MARDLDTSRSGKPTLAKRGVAALVLVAAAALAVYLVIGVIKVILIVAVVVAVIGAVLWAANQLL